MKNLTVSNAATTLLSRHSGGKLVDTHQLQREAMAQFPEEFMQDFVPYKGDFTAFSGQFSQWVGRQGASVIVATQSVPSRNLLGNVSDNQQWKVI